jgi:16S rRNA (guanine966-N2)-methyltransferase
VTKPTLRAPHRVRIIGGQWKRTPLPVLQADGLRPTPDRVRETLFNWLNHLLNGRWDRLCCLDLFAGTGALGFEAASRGASSVLMIEANLAGVRQLETTKARLKADAVKIECADALRSAQRLVQAGVRFDLVFLDPPYRQAWLEKVLPFCVHLLLPGGLVYVEAEQRLDGEAVPEWLYGWDVVRSDKAGSVAFHLLQCKIAPGIEA